MVKVLAQFFERRRTDPIFNFSLRGKYRYPYLQDHGPRAGDLRCVELSFFDFVCQLAFAKLRTSVKKICDINGG
jgi:hypothetical protein